jgi:predicted PurR-regulated permease PerM
MKNKKKCVNFGVYKIISVIIVLLIVAMLIFNNNVQKKDSITNQMVVNKLLDNSNKYLQDNRNILQPLIPQIVKIESDNFVQVSQKYSFAFSESIESDYGYTIANNGDYIIIYENIIFVYSYENDFVKSLFQFKTIGN